MSVEKRKRQLAQAALRVFSERGFSGATTKETSNTAGRNSKYGGRFGSGYFSAFRFKRRTLYEHFGRKDEPHIFPKVDGGNSEIR